MGSIAPSGVQEVRGTTRCVSLHATKYTYATVFYKMILLGRILKSPIFVIQKAATPKNGVEFCQKSIGVIRYCLDTLYDDVRRHGMLPGGLWCLHGDIILKADHYMHSRILENLHLPYSA